MCGGKGGLIWGLRGGDGDEGWGLVGAWGGGDAKGDESVRV